MCFFSICKNKAQKIIPHVAELFENSYQSWLSQASYNILELQVANGHILTTSTALALTVIYPAASSNRNVFLLFVSPTNRHYESMTQFSYHDIMSLHLSLLTGEFLTFQLQTVQDIKKSKYNTDLDLHPPNVN